MKLEHGDAIERAEAQWIREQIPIYEEIWGRYIGNNGKGEPLPLLDCPSNFQPNRSRFNECHYSILLSLIILRNERDRHANNLEMVKSVQDYLEVMRDLTSFMAHVGRLRDLFEEITKCLNADRSIWSRFDDYYVKRSVIIHGSLMPIEIEEGFVKLPALESRTSTVGVWGSKSTWSESHSIRHSYMIDFMSDTFNALLELVRASLSQVLQKLKNDVPSACLLVLPSTQRQESPNLAQSISAGSAVFTVNPPSGVRI